ncbi:MAG: phosphotransferase [Phycisphaerales bacterium]
MPKGGAHFTSQELALVLSHYDIGIIQQIKNVVRGSRKAPKQIIVSDKGRYFLKRRAKGKDIPARIEFAHEVQKTLNQNNFPVSKLIPSRDTSKTFLEIEGHIYELFEFALGSRFDGRVELVENAGETLANFHKILKNHTFASMSQRSSFHDSKSVRSHLKKISSDNHLGTDKTVSQLMTIYNHASVNVNQFGFDQWPKSIVHGDWHPGNMLFSGSKISAVFDFDSLNLAPITTDIANGALQFSIVAGRPDPAEWPDYLDESKFVAFINGYRKTNPISENEIKSLLDLMIETLIAEAVLPIAATGYFSNFSGIEFLKMIHRKCTWIENNRKLLASITSK